MAATAFFACSGHERWHHDPDFYYQPGGGPRPDMGPYYLTALIHLLGPVESVLGAVSRSGDERTIGSGPRRGSACRSAPTPTSPACSGTRAGR